MSYSSNMFCQTELYDLLLLNIKKVYRNNSIKRKTYVHRLFHYKTFYNIKTVEQTTNFRHLFLYNTYTLHYNKDKNDDRINLLFFVKKNGLLIM